MNIGQKLRAELKKQGRSLKHVALETGIPYNTLSPYLRGVNPIPKCKLLVICLAFDIDPKIFGLADENSSKKAV